jgi:hypothetical protein
MKIARNVADNVHGLPLNLFQLCSKLETSLAALEFEECLVRILRKGCKMDVPAAFFR